MKPWHLYLLECRDGSLYAGVTTDLAARYRAHASGTGAKYTRSRPPVRFAATAAFPCRSTASRAEWLIKQQPRNKKIEWLRRAGAEAAANLIGIPLHDWSGNRVLVVSRLSRSGLYDGVAYYGEYLGPSLAHEQLEPGCHSWIVCADGQIVDPIRWVIEGASPYIHLVSADSPEYREAAPQGLGLDAS